jgi:hypothetical protein
MRHLTNSLDVPAPAASPSQGQTKDTGAACRERASADLVKSVTALTANQKRVLERSAETWTLRGAMLDRIDKSIEKRRALDEASAEYETKHERS